MGKHIKREWGYGKYNGPEMWCTLCEEFKVAADYPYQSPIALAEKETVIPDFSGIEFNYQTALFRQEIIDYTVHFVPVTTTNTVRFKRKDFVLNDIHFHIPSEHILDEQQTEVEFHFVHQAADGELLVVGMLYDVINDDYNLMCNQQDLFLWQTGVPEQHFNPEHFLPEDKTYFHYIGSRTTPPTVGPVLWFVFQQVGRIGRYFIESLRTEERPMNTRGLQDKKDRLVYYFDKKMK